MSNGEVFAWLFVAAYCALFGYCLWLSFTNEDSCI